MGRTEGGWYFPPFAMEDMPRIAGNLGVCLNYWKPLRQLIPFGQDSARSSKWLKNID
jgi:hypothetical protein